MMNGSCIYGGDYFAVYTNIESLCCTSETNIILHVNYISKRKKERERKRKKKENKKVGRE